MEQVPVIQTFFNRPVRFFKTEFEMEIGGHDAPQSSRKNTELRGHDDPPALRSFHMETWVIPFPDFCRAINYDERALKRVIERSDEVFKPFYRKERILDMGGVQHRETILMTYEMCQLLVAKLETSRIKDPETKAMVINFQRWVMFIFHLIRTHKLRPTYWKPTKAVLDEYERVLLLPMGVDAGKEVKALAEKHGKSLQQEYRRLQKVRGSNAITSKGKPKKSPSTKGKHKMPEEAQKIIDTANANPGLTNKEIWEKSGTTYSYGHVNQILRKYKH